jgi:excisionase family DNA binding protein
MDSTTDTAKPPAGSLAEQLALSAEQVARVLGISRAHVFRLASSGRLPRSIRLGRAVRWDRRTIERWLDAGAPPRDLWEQMESDRSSKARG